MSFCLYVFAFLVPVHPSASFATSPDAEPACNDITWYRIRERLRHILLTPDFKPGGTWLARDLPEVSEDVGLGLPSCESGRTAIKLLVAYHSVVEAIARHRVEEWFHAHQDILSKKVGAWLLVHPFPFAAILSFLHRRLWHATFASTCVVFASQACIGLIAGLAVKSCFPSTETCAKLLYGLSHLVHVASTNVGSLRELAQQHLLRGRTLKYPASLGFLAASIVNLLANRSSSFVGAKLHVEKLELDMTLADALQSPWPVFELLRRLQSQWFFTATCPGGSYLQWSRTDPSFLICVPFRAGILQGTFSQWGQWKDCQYLQAWLPPASADCDVVVEAGSSFGVCTLLLARKGFKVIAIDAQKWHVELLRASVKLNQFDHVKVIHAAVADAPGQAHLHVPSDGAFARLDYHRSMETADAIAEGSSVEAVKVTTVDAEAGESPVCALKTDVEGVDVLALLGAQNVIARAQVVAFELQKNPSNRVELSTAIPKLFQQLTDQGFSLRKLNADPHALVDSKELEQIQLCRDGACVGDFVAYSRRID